MFFPSSCTADVEFSQLFGLITIPSNLNFPPSATADVFLPAICADADCSGSPCKHSSFSRVLGAMWRLGGSSQRPRGSCEHVDGNRERLRGCSRRLDGGSQRLRSSCERLGGNHERLWAVRGAPMKVRGARVAAASACVVDTDAAPDPAPSLGRPCPRPGPKCRQTQSPPQVPADLPQTLPAPGGRPRGRPAPAPSRPWGRPTQQRCRACIPKPAPGPSRPCPWALPRPAPGKLLTLNTTAESKCRDEQCWKRSRSCRKVHMLSSRCCAKTDNPQIGLC